MKILFAGQVGESLPPLYAGVPKRALLLAKAWREKGNTVGICFTYHHAREDDLGASADYFFEYGKRPGILAKLSFFLGGALLHPFSYLDFLVRAVRMFKLIDKDIVLYAAYGVFLDRVVKRYRPDLIVAESGMHRSFYAAQVAKRRGIPFVLETYAEVHDDSIMYLGSAANRARFWTEFLAIPDRIIAPSEYCGIGPREYAPEGSVKMIYATTLDVEIFADDRRTRSEARAHFKLPEGRFLVTAVGSYTARKGHDHIIEALASLRKDGKDVGAIFCGEGKYGWLKELAEKLGIGDAISFYQNLSEDELRLLFKAADVYCDASNTPRACLGIALTEGLATRLPAIAYDVAGLPEVVIDGDNGILVPLDNVEKLAEAMDRVRLMSPEKRLALGNRGFERARAVFDLPTIAAELFAEFTSVVTNHVRP